MKITCWNVRGLNKPEKCRELNRIIKSAACDIVILVETKIKQSRVQAQKNLIWPDAELFTNDSNETFGRIWVLWHPNSINAWFISATDQFIHLKVEDKKNGCQFNFIGIYASNSMQERNTLWSDLTNIANGCLNVPWIVLGDFNTVRYTNEKEGGRQLSESQLQSFNDYIDTAALFNMKSVGNWLSWSNQGG